MNSFLEGYKESKKVRDLIKQPVFKSKSISETYYYYDNHDLTFKITHVKSHERWSCSIKVNIKVCGKMKGLTWNSDVNGMSNINYSAGFRSAVSRNRKIRNHTENEIKKYLRLFGVNSFNIEIGKITVTDSL